MQLIKEDSDKVKAQRRKNTVKTLHHRKRQEEKHTMAGKAANHCLWFCYIAAQPPVNNPLASVYCLGCSFSPQLREVTGRSRSGGSNGIPGGWEGKRREGEDEGEEGGRERHRSLDKPTKLGSSGHGCVS